MQAVKTRRRAFLAPTIRHNETLNPMSAVLHSVCAGYGLHSNGVSSAVLAEANTPFALQEHAIQAGLVATPFMVPPDLLTNPPLFQHPLIVRSIADEDAPARMMIVWNQLFTWIQLMDTATGQRWVNQQQLIAETAVDTVTLTPDEWLAMATSSLWQPLWLHRLQALGFERSHALDFLQTPLSSADWHTVAALDAALRLVSQFQKKRLLRTGRSARESFVHIYQQAIDAGPTQSHLVLPLVYWSVRPAPDSELSAPATLTYQAVQVVQLAAPLSDASSTTVSSPDVAPTPAEDEKALPSSTGASVPQTIVAFLRREGRLPFVILTTALIFAAGSVVLQALLLHGAMNIGLIFSATEQRFTLMSLLITFAVVLLLLEWHINATIARIGRRLDARLRIAVLERLPTLGPLTLQQRSTADQMERIHAARDLHNLPEFVARVVRNGLLLVFTVLGIAWIDPVSAFLGLLIVAVVFSPLFLLRSSLEALNLDARTRLAGLMRLNLDGMLGLPAILAHSAENTIRSVYETYLARWVRSILNLARVEFWVAACEQTLVYFLIALTVGWFALRTGDGTDLPLLLFWLLQLAVVGREFARNMFRYENEQSKCTRFVDLLMETETGVAPVTPAASQSPNVAQTEAAPLPNAGVAITFSHVSVASLEQPILDHVHLDIVPGSTVAIVGPSGAGKSTLLGLLLGKQQPASGAITIDGQLLDGQHLTYIRQNTAWVDPSVQIWNRSFLYNVRYGGEQTPINWILDHANLRDVLALLPDGMQTSLGERGRLVAGGQGQRVRLGRAFQRPDARLVLLDEPFRGLEREQRAALLAQARSFWSGATFLCVTHDIAHTTSFDRVLVVEHGRIVEDGAPADLLAQPKSRYKTFFDAEQRVHQRLWFGNAIAWRELWMENGQLHERTSRLADHQRSISLANPNRTHPAPVSSAVAPSIPDTRNDLDQLAWPAADASEAVRVLATASGLIQKSSSPPPGEDTTRPVSLAQQIMSTAGELGLEAQPLDVTYQQIMAVLQDGGPALIQLADDRLLLIRGGTRWWTSIIGPDGRTRRLRPGVIHDALAQSVEAPLQAEGAGVLDHLNLSATQRSQAQRLLFQAQLPDAPVTHAWLLHPSPGMSLFQQMRDAGLWRYLAIALTGEFALSVLYIAVFAISAFATVRGYIEPVWLVAVLLLLLLRLPAEMARWWGERFMGVGLRDVLKRRLFFGIVHVQPDTVQHHGTGQFLGWVMESERLEEIARAGPVLLNAALTLLVSSVLLSLGAGGLLHVLLLASFLLLVVLVGRGSLRAYLAQRLYNHQITRDLLERMEGHQTRLVQEHQARWHEEEDQELAHYHMLSKKDDWYRTLMAVVVPYGWLVASLLLLLPSFIVEPDAWLALGGSFLGTLWVFQTFQAAVPDVLDLIRAIGARRMLTPIEDAAMHQTLHEQAEATKPCPPPAADNQDPQHPLLEVHDVRFTHSHQERPALTNCMLHIYRGDRLLLTGPSGSGKSTLATLLAGRRVPQAGLLLLYGLDQPALGKVCWRRSTVIAPQFHENHIIDASLAFNLLMGRVWPPTTADLAAAEAVCRDLGLGDLLDRMPNGLHERVGETGWHLSHGERSRLFMARALLQGASITILDESFGSLDAETMEMAMSCALKQTSTLLVIAHP